MYYKETVKMISCSVFLLYLLLLSYTNNQVLAKRQCQSKSAVCVAAKFCPPIYDAIVASKKNHIRKSYIRALECYKSGGKKRFCCEPTDTTIGKNCVVRSHEVSGRCVAPEHCSFHNSKMSKKARKHPENLCYQDGKKEYFCCPDEYLVSSRTKTYGTRLNEQPLAIQNDFPACEDARAEPGLCVPVRLCDHIYPASLDGRINTNTSLQQFVRRSSCSSDARPSTSICCATSTARSGLEYIQHKNAAKLGLDHCGHEGFVDKILEGSETASGRYPWMARLLSKCRNTWKTHCSGSLIHPKYVLTAAHCIKLSSLPKAVLLGEHNISNIQYYMKKTYAGPGQVHAIEKLIPNKNFNGYNSEYDIALIRLATQATLIPDLVYPICLPITKTLLMLKPKKLVVLGWGGTGKQKQSDVLREAELQLTKRTATCLSEETFCARGKSKEGHCKGDSGGPYQAAVPVNNENDNKCVLFGVISKGARYCNVRDEQPGVGVFVGSHINWILDNLKI